MISDDKMKGLFILLTVSLMCFQVNLAKSHDDNRHSRDTHQHQHQRHFAHHHQSRHHNFKVRDSNSSSNLSCVDPQLGTIIKWINSTSSKEIRLLFDIIPASFKQSLNGTGNNTADNSTANLIHENMEQFYNKTSGYTIIPFFAGVIGHIFSAKFEYLSNNSEILIIRHAIVQAFSSGSNRPDAIFQSIANLLNRNGSFPFFNNVTSNWTNLTGNVIKEFEQVVEAEIPVFPNASNFSNFSRMFG
ncbi:hypothetical protein ABEB36_003968 [Hypothenemus hampei]|uniref:Uncharacterized protein n=1 Tax=Hypothenemus hampei TaxID=57062 RepID=A0ABD1F5H7_HYPHA